MKKLWVKASMFVMGLIAYLILSITCYQNAYAEKLGGDELGMHTVGGLYELYQNDDAKLYVARYHARRRNLEKALPLLEDILRSHPGSSGAIEAERLLTKLQAKTAPKGTTPPATLQSAPTPKPAE